MRYKIPFLYCVDTKDGVKEFKDLESAEEFLLFEYSSNYNNRDCSQDEELYEEYKYRIWLKDANDETVDYEDIRMIGDEDICTDDEVCNPMDDSDHYDKDIKGL